jgi:hypothetical protein
MKTFVDLAEMVPTGQYLAEDKRGPALGEYLRRSGDWAELTISRHSQIVVSIGSPSKY